MEFDPKENYNNKLMEKKWGECAPLVKIIKISAQKTNHNTATQLTNATQVIQGSRTKHD